ncbi:MAG: amidohydrolase family protein [candidate division KSB1 bacterium]|nr:amidohydrolase family protein [candidate division KSB1 bacterium]MDZ7342665.1 amidohydrolase family protein [candidate division KSB1 bacterium]
MKIIQSLITVALVWLVACSDAEDQMHADLIMVDGKIYTVEPAQPWAEACAIKDGKFIAVGKSEAIQKFKGKRTGMIDLNGRLVLPGFNDAHVHFADGGFYLAGINLRDAKDETEFVARIKNYAAKLNKGEWILNGNWDHEVWPSKKHPNKALIDSVTTENPVLVQRLDGHIALANSLALKLAGITKATPNPQGGEIVKDPRTGEPTGILKDNAQSLVGAVIPAPTKSQLKQAIKTAIQHANSLGVTSVQDNSSAADLEIYQELLREGELTLRINAWRYGYLYENFETLGIRPAFGNDMLRIGTVKIFVDGSMGAGTALFFAPYEDDPTTSGIPIYKEKDLYDLIQAIDKAGLQIAAHAIGDKANTWILNAFEQAFAANGRRDARHRIEHAQVVLPEDVIRYKELGIIASIQPSHCIDDMRWAEKRIGTRCQNAYRFKSFLDAGVKIAFGTDWTVEPLNPMLGLYAAVTREFPEGGPEGGWYPAEKLTLAQAIELYTMGSAYAEFQEQVKGSIKVGKLADLVVLDRNLFEIPAKEILQTKVELSIVNGRIVYQK